MKINDFVLKNITGFSLTEVMIGGSILAAIGLTAATLFKDQRTAQKVIETASDIDTYHRILARTLTDANNCNATFKASDGSNSLADISSIRTCASSCNLASDASSVITSAPIISEGDFIDNKQIWKLETIDVPTGIIRTGIARVRVTYSTTKPTAKSVIKDLMVGVRFTKTGTPVFKECFDAMESSLNNLQKDMCEHIASDDNEFAVWNDDTQTCTLRGSAGTPLEDCAPQGEAPAGIKDQKYPSGAAGDTPCVKLKDTINMPPLVNSAPAICVNPTPNARLQWDNTAKNFRVVCQ